eukprot:4551524-Amphidinium_carterae.1
MDERKRDSVELELLAAMRSHPFIQAVICYEDQIRVPPREHADPHDEVTRLEIARDAMQKQRLRHKFEGTRIVSHRFQGNLRRSL